MSVRPLSDGKLAALTLLHQAYEDAAEVKAPTREFAVTRDELVAAGANESDLRWMLARHFAEQLLEPHVNGHDVRTFCIVGGLRIADGGRFALTYAGKVFAENKRLATTPPRNIYARSCGLPQRGCGASKRIRWDRALRELWVDAKLAKRFRRSAPAQWRILDAFQRARWPAHVRIRLKSSRGRIAGRRLSEVVADLNSGLDASLIRFHLDGTGKGVYFDLS